MPARHPAPHKTAFKNMNPSETLSKAAVGVGLRHPHYTAFEYADMATLAPAQFVEVHSENFFTDGGAARALLRRIRERLPVSLHGVGLGLGNANGLRVSHLARLKALVEEIEPALVSEHACWTAAAVGGEQIALNDLLPLPHTRHALNTLCKHIDQVQMALKRSILIENTTAYVRFDGDEMSEGQFLAAVAQRTGCGILLDVNNLYINAVHFGFDAAQELTHLPAQVIGQIHLAGHLVTPDGLVDDHGSRVSPAVWRLYDEALRRFGARPTLIEWDTDIPALDVLLAEAATAQAHMHAQAETIAA